MDTLRQSTQINFAPEKLFNLFAPALACRTALPMGRSQPTKDLQDRHFNQGVLRTHVDQEKEWKLFSANDIQAHATQEVSDVKFEFAKFCAKRFLFVRFAFFVFYPERGISSFPSSLFPDCHNSDSSP
jgi:hypothetical protein